MNNNIKVLSLFLLILILGCKSKKPSITTYSNKEQVVLRINKKYKKIFRINIPTKINVKNNSIQKKSFISIDYKYNSYSKGIGESIYVLEGDKSIKIINNERKTIGPFSSYNYLIYSWFRIDTSKATQKEFKPYIEKMLAHNKDTLHIGTVNQFKKKHRELYEKLTSNDSISIRFFDSGKKRERISVSVN